MVSLPSEASSPFVWSCLGFWVVVLLFFLVFFYRLLLLLFLIPNNLK